MDSIDRKFRLNEGNILTGEINWEGGGEGTTKGRNSFELQSTYVCKWEDYSSLESASGNNDTYSEFKYLLLEV